MAASGEIGDDIFPSYFVIQTPEMLERYERFVAPTAALMPLCGRGWGRSGVVTHRPAVAGGG